MAALEPGGDVVSMLDVLQEDAALEDEANAVLGGSDDKQCTYNQGYVKRQALYACATCAEGADATAGICLACSLHCHDGHSLYELYTKRNFRCDCGNSKFPSLRCSLLPEKEATNPSNKYNHNFKGLYCTCKRPYPDPDAEEEEEMIQCIRCEDWYHSHHLKGKVPECDDYHEMVCHQCMDTLPFLYAYLSPQRLKALVESADMASTSVADSDPSCKDENKMMESSNLVLKNEDETVDVMTADGDGPSPKKKTRLEDAGSTGETQASEETTDSKVDSVVEQADNASSSSSHKPACKLTYHWTTVGDRRLEEAAFLDEGWRSSLCSCTECKELYARDGLTFLFDDDDTVATYEARGKLSGQNPSTFERGVQALETSLNRTQQVEMLTHFNDLKSELSQYLRQFADENKVVTEEHIREFFQRMEQQRRDRVVHGVPPQYCGQ